MGSHQSIRKTVAPEIPDKLYFRIGDVAKLCEVPAYVLRFWETEFPQLKPNKGGTGQRLYRKRDVEMALRIKSLLYDQGYTIPGARQVFKTDTKPAESRLHAAEARVSEARVDETRTTEIRSNAPQVISSPEAQPLEDAGTAIRRRAKLEALRKEMQSLLTMISSSPDAAAPKAKVQAMRPRLAIEPARTPARPVQEHDAPESKQRDLF